MSCELCNNTESSEGHKLCRVDYVLRINGGPRQYCVLQKKLCQVCQSKNIVSGKEFEERRKLYPQNDDYNEMSPEITLE